MKQFLNETSILFTLDEGVSAAESNAELFNKAMMK